jgi:hypothetical protein
MSNVPARKRDFGVIGDFSQGRLYVGIGRVDFRFFGRRDFPRDRRRFAKLRQVNLQLDKRRN